MQSMKLKKSSTLENHINKKIDTAFSLYRDSFIRAQMVFDQDQISKIQKKMTLLHQLKKKLVKEYAQREEEGIEVVDRMREFNVE